MRLSVAIRLGSMMKAQITHRYRSETGTCAYGAALEAVGTASTNFNYKEVVRLWPYVAAFAEDPLMAGKLFAYGDVLWRNDDLKWTRETIADWVEEREKGLDAVVPEPQPAVVEEEVTV